MIKILVNQDADEDDEAELQKEAAADRAEAGEASQVSNPPTAGTVDPMAETPVGGEDD